MNEAIESNKLMRKMGQGRPRSCTGSETSFVKQCEGYFVNILAGILVPAIIEQNNLVSFVSRILPADLGSEPEDQDCFKKAQTISGTRTPRTNSPVATWSESRPVSKQRILLSLSQEGLR